MVILDIDNISNVNWAPQGLDIQPDGRILVAGNAGNPDYIEFAVLRLLQDGSPDPSFDLQDVLGMLYEAQASTVVAGQTLTFTALLENHYGAAITDARIVIEHDGLETLRVDGATPDADGGLTFERLEPKEIREVRILARVSVGAREASSSLLASYGAEGVPEPNIARTEPLWLEVMGGTHVQGCECGSTGGGFSYAVPLWMLLLFVGRSRRRRRGRGGKQPTMSRRPEPERST